LAFLRGLCSACAASSLASRKVSGMERMTGAGSGIGRSIDVNAI
jgi:hypothetical protein